MILGREQGRFVKGNHYSPDTEFKKGQHWREKKPYWDKDWLYNEYIIKQKPTEQIAEETGCKERNIQYFLKKHIIPTRTMIEIRSIKHWGLSGSDNGMYGRCGKESSNWKGGITPERQAFYNSEEWKKVVPLVWKRDKAICQKCDTHKQLYKDDFHIHHIISFEVVELRADLDNLLLFCRDCHIWVHSKNNVEGIFIENV